MFNYFYIVVYCINVQQIISDLLLPNEEKGDICIIDQPTCSLNSGIGHWIKPILVDHYK